MKKKIITSLFIGLVGLSLAACGAAQDTSTSSTSVEEQVMIDVKDTNGTVSVPENPEKVVVFDNGSLDTLDALGVGDRVVGAAVDNLPAYLSDYRTVESAGGLKEPDLEKINQLQPDLIIISGRQADFLEDLSAIAPTVYLAVDPTNTWESIQQNVTTLGRIFGKETEADTALEELATRIDETKEKASASGEKALVTLVNEGSLSAYGVGSRFGIIHDTFGFLQADEGIEASTHGQSVSYEYVLETNPDILFVIDRTQAIGGDDSNDNVADNELVKRTKAGENQNVISLQADVWYLSGGGLESVGLMLDDVNQAFK